MEKYVATAKFIRDSLTDGLSAIQSDGLTDFVVQAPLKQIDIFIIKLKEFIAIAEGSLDSRAGDFEEIKATRAQIKADGCQYTKTLKMQIKSATLLKDGGGSKAKGKKRAADDA